MRGPAFRDVEISIDKYGFSLRFLNLCKGTETPVQNGGDSELFRTRAFNAVDSNACDKLKRHNSVIDDMNDEVSMEPPNGIQERSERKVVSIKIEDSKSNQTKIKNSLESIISNIAGNTISNTRTERVGILEIVDKILKISRCRFSVHSINQIFSITPLEKIFIEGDLSILILQLPPSIETSELLIYIEAYSQVLLTDDVAVMSKLAFLKEFDAGNIDAVLQIRQKLDLTVDLRQFFKKLNLMFSNEKIIYKQRIDAKIFRYVMPWVLTQICLAVSQPATSSKMISNILFNAFHREQALAIFPDSPDLFERYSEHVAKVCNLRPTEEGLYFPQRAPRAYLVELFQSKSFASIFAKCSMDSIGLLEHHQNQLISLLERLAVHRERAKSTSVNPTVSPGLLALREELAALPPYSLLLYGQRLINDLAQSCN